MANDLRRHFKTPLLGTTLFKLENTIFGHNIIRKSIYNMANNIYFDMISKSVGVEQYLLLS